ncbi:MAG: hypothetical protein ACXVAN_03070, partial [Polyangia bacterium]
LPALLDLVRFDHGTTRVSRVRARAKVSEHVRGDSDEQPEQCEQRQNQSRGGDAVHGARAIASCVPIVAERNLAQLPTVSVAKSVSSG